MKSFQDWLKIRESFGESPYSQDPDYIPKKKQPLIGSRKGARLGDMSDFPAPESEAEEEDLVAPEDQIGGAPAPNPDDLGPESNIAGTPLSKIQSGEDDDDYIPSPLEDKPDVEDELSDIAYVGSGIPKRTRLGGWDEPSSRLPRHQTWKVGQPAQYKRIRRA